MEHILKIAVGGTLKVTIILLMVSLGLQTSHREILFLWRRPSLFFRCLIAAFIVVPITAYLVFQLLPLTFEDKVGLWVVAIAPGAPMIYRTALSRGLGNKVLAASFQITVALLVILFAPIWLAIISLRSGESYWIPPVVVAKQVFTIQIIPIVTGLMIHHWLPSFAERIKELITKICTPVFVVLIVVLLIVFGPRAIESAELWRIVATVIVASAAVAGGHYLAGPEPSWRVTIANANVQRNPGLALLIAAWNLPEEKSATVMVIVTYVLIAFAVAAVYTSIYRKRIVTH